MAIELLDMRKTWARIRSGMKQGNLFRNPPPRESHPYRDGRSSLVDEAQGISASPKSVFGGKTFSQRRK